MKAAFTTFALAAGASASAVLPRADAGCCFGLTASGGVSGTVSQLSDGQNRVGGADSSSATPARYCLNNGGITDANGRGCILTPPTTQFQCDSGASPTTGFSVSGSGNVAYNGTTQFVACPVNDQGEYNIYTTAPAGQGGCKSITLSTGGACVSSSAASSAPASSAPASSAPASSASASSAHASSSASAASASSASASSAHASSSASVSSVLASSSASVSSAHASSSAASSASVSSVSSVHASSSAPVVPVSSAPVAPVSSASVSYVTSCTTYAVTHYVPVSSAPASSAPASAPVSSAPASSAPAPSAPASSVHASSSAPASSAPASSVHASSSVPAPSAPVVPVTSVHASSSAPAPSAPASSAPAPSAPASSAHASSSAPAPTAPASAPAASSSAATKASASASGSACATTLQSGAYQTPHHIVPVNKNSPSTSYGTQYDASINGQNSTIFQFDIPESYAGKQCSLVFLWPEESQLQTSSFTTSGSGGLTFGECSVQATDSTTYASAGSVTPVGSVSNAAPGHSYVITSGPCAAGQSVSYAASASGSLSLTFFEDWNPSPIGAFITSC